MKYRSMLQWRVIFIIAFSLVVFSSLKSQWKLSLDTDEIIFYTNAMMANQKYMYCNTYKDVYRSADQGQSWELAFDSGEAFYAYVRNMFVQEKRLWIVGDWTLGEYFVKYSDDYGTTWETLTSNGYPKNCIANYNDVLFMGGPYYPPGNLATVFRSFDNGHTWEQLINNGLPVKNATVEQMVVFNGRLFACYLPDKGVYTTTDLGESWVSCQVEATVTNAELEFFGVTPLGLTLVYRNSLDYNDKEVFVTANGQVWQKPSVPTGVQPAIFAGDARQWLSVDDNGFSQVTYDKGAHWFDWSEIEHPNATNMRPKSYFVLQNTAFAIFGSNLYRRPLAEADPPEIPEPDELETTGNPALDQLLEEFGASSVDELPVSVLEDFLLSNEDASLWDEPFGSGQPGTCNYMGTPLWNVDGVSAQLHISDRIFGTKSLGPDPEVQVCYQRNQDAITSTLGTYWGLSFDEEVHVTDTTVSIISYANGKRVFELDNPVAGPVRLTHKLHVGDTLSWDGLKWIFYNSQQRQTKVFSNLSPRVFQLTSVFDREGNNLAIERNASGLITKIIDAPGRIITFQYSGGKCTGFTLPDSRAATFAYNGNGLLSATTDLAGVTTTYTYTAGNDIATIDVAGKQTHFTYAVIAGFSRVNRIVGPTSDTTDFAFEYIAANQTALTITSGESQKRYLSTSGRTYQVEADGGKTAQRLFNADGQLTSLELPGGKQKRVSYDANGNLLSVSDDSGLLYSFTWDANHNLTSKTNALGNTWTYSYDNAARLQVLTTPMGRKTQFGYYSNGLLKSIKHGSLTTSYTYDANGNLLTITNPNGGVTAYAYDASGYRLQSVTSPLGKVTSYTYDNNARLTSITYADGEERSYTYSCCAQNSKTDENGNTVHINRNSNNLIESITDPQSNTRSWEYNAKGLPITFTNELGYTQQYAYNEANQISQLTDELGNPTYYNYDLQHRLLSITDAGGSITKFQRNTKGELTAIIYNKFDTVKYTRDAIDQITQVRNARKQIIDMAYDADGNAISRITPEGTQAFTWDTETGYFTGYSDNFGATGYQLDEAGLISLINYNDKFQVQIEHDLDGNITKYTYPGGLIVQNQFDDRNRLTSTTWGNESVAFTYDAAGNLLSELRSNGYKTNYTYSSVNKISSLEHKKGEAVSTDYQITRNAVGAIISLDQLPAIAPQHGTSTWYDYWYTNDNQLIENSKADLGTNTYYQYDADGNCTSIVGQIQFKASYNSMNRLTGLRVGSDTLSLAYDAMGYVRKLVEGQSEKRLFYDQKGRLMFEADASNTVKRLYIYRGRRLIAFVEGGQSYFMHYDYNGNTVFVSDENGNIRNKYFYSAFGEVLARQEQVPNHFTYSGAFGVLDLMDGYYLMHARLYQATNARFLQRDPLNYQGDVNAYRYASNDAVNRIDPLGLDDALETINATEFDGGYDYDPGIAGGTADAFNPKLKHSANSGTDPVEILGTLYNGITDTPLGDLLPGGLGKLVAIQKAAKKGADGKGLLEVGWQFVPFNNTMEFIYKEKKKELEERAWNYYHLPDGREKLVEKPFGSCSIW